MLQRGTPLQRPSSRAQPQPEVNQEPDQKQRRRVEYPAKLPCCRPRCKLARQDQRAESVLIAFPRHGAHRFQGIVHSGKQVVEQTPMRQQRDNGIAIGGLSLFGEFIQPILDLASSRRRRIERQIQHRSRSGADGWPELRRNGTHAEPPEKGKRVVQQGIVALEPLHQIFLPVDGGRKSIHRFRRLGIDHGRLA